MRTQQQPGSVPGPGLRTGRFGSSASTTGRPPAGPVVLVESYGDPEEPTPFFPGEEELVARAVATRRAEFATARACARAALAQLGVAPAAILRGERGEPLWPAGIVGAMTHCTGYRAAAVARAGDVVSLGLDAEPHLPMPGEGELRLVTVAEERRNLPLLTARRPDICWDRLLFSAKESVYKAWYPLAGRWLGFEDAVITVDPDAGTFTARLLVPGPVLAGEPLAGFDGTWTVQDGLIRTAVAVIR
ncbi:4'-phosphopantetheinyl transferase [Streptomyces sp. NBC_00859]|uniref:4'-phosphopantetheinyl transferase family protein n=1 Tax=Streptomyces sp. NBC_00859 TaxID=2903682 RepID=UPI00386F5023|nr:4'-phosphopantetheinyl transferase superfamily protein [Streptomyces sp. NBC_00859]